MKNALHEFRYILHLKNYDEGVFFYREVLGLQPNYNWAIIPDQKGYRFYMGNGRLEIVQYPFIPPQGKGEFKADCVDLDLCMARMFSEMPDVEILEKDRLHVTLKDPNGNVIHLMQGHGEHVTTGPVDKTNMFTGNFTGILYEKDLEQAKAFYCGQIGLDLLYTEENICLLKAGDAYLELRKMAEGVEAGPSMIAFEADSVNKLYDKLSTGDTYQEAGVLHDTDFDARRLFQVYDPSGNVVEIYAYLRNVREEILLH
nr:VOC family protein [uncultured Oscillibacter sp.]